MCPSSLPWREESAPVANKAPSEDFWRGSPSVCS